MPLYEYQCDACGCRFEVIQKFSDPAVDTCRECGKGPVHRLFSSPAIQFKGSGWYITDYAQKGKSDPATSGTAAKSDAAKSDTASSDGSSGKSDAAKSDTGSTSSSTAKESKGSSTAKESKG